MFKKSIFLAVLILFSCPSVYAEQNSLQIKGSDTMVNLGQAWAENYMSLHPEAFVAVTGGGSGTGFSALLSGTCDIAETSRKIKDKEVEMAKAKGIQPKEYTVAWDGIAVVVNPKNPVSQLTVDQLAEIFTGKIKNWKELGGKDLVIVVLSREVNSGTHVYFKEHILRKNDATRKDEFTDDALLMSSSQAIADEITQNENAIGYYGMGYITKNQKAILIAKDKDGPYVDPTIENVMKGHYYISRPLLMYTNGTPTGLAKNFIDYVLSDKGQEEVRAIDFVPIR